MKNKTDNSSLGAQPMMRLSNAEKMADDMKWYKEQIDRFISISSFSQIVGVTAVHTAGTSMNSHRDISKLINLYHSKLDGSWFDDVTNQLRVKDNKVNIGIKIKEINILKPTIDFLHSNFKKRNINYFVVNEAEEAYSSYLEAQNKAVAERVNARFAQLISDENAINNPVDIVPKQIKESFSLTYRDAVADKFQKRMKNTLERLNIFEIWSEVLLDFLIMGEPVTCRELVEDRTFYRRVDRRLVEYDKNPQDKYAHQAEWWAEVQMLSSSDIYLRYDLTEEEMVEVDSRTVLSSQQIQSFFSSMGIDNYKKYLNKIPVFHVYWRGRKKYGILSYYDENGFLQTTEVSEDYEPMEGEEVVWKQKNVIYTGDRIFHNIYKNIREFDINVNPPVGYSKPMMPYNSFRFSHYDNDKVYSPLSLGIPMLVMYLSCLYLAEKLMYKHKGKMLLMDVNAIPNQKGWNEKAFLLYAEKLGYVFVNRSQEGVDKAFNQYQTIEISTLNDVNELFQAAEFYKRMWDDIISIPPQMRGQTFSTDEVGTTKSAIYQSGISIDYIYQRFDDFLTQELHYLLALERESILRDTGKFTFIDEGIVEYLEILKTESMDKLGIRMSNNSKEYKQFEEIKQVAMNMNQQEPIALVEIMTSENIPNLKKKLQSLQDRAQERIMAEKQAESQKMKELEEMKFAFEKVKADLDKMLLNIKYDREENLARVEAEVNPVSGGVDKNHNGIPDYTEANMKNATENRKLDIQERKNVQDYELGKEKNKIDKSKNNKPK